MDALRELVRLRAGDPGMTTPDATTNPTPGRALDEGAERE